MTLLDLMLSGARHARKPDWEPGHYLELPLRPGTTDPLVLAGRPRVNPWCTRHSPGSNPVSVPYFEVHDNKDDWEAYSLDGT